MIKKVDEADALRWHSKLSEVLLSPFFPKEKVHWKSFEEPYSSFYWGEDLTDEGGKPALRLNVEIRSDRVCVSLYGSFGMAMDDRDLIIASLKKAADCHLFYITQKDFLVGPPCMIIPDESHLPKLAEEVQSYRPDWVMCPMYERGGRALWIPCPTSERALSKIKEIRAEQFDDSWPLVKDPKVFSRFVNRKWYQTSLNSMLIESDGYDLRGRFLPASRVIM